MNERLFELLNEFGQELKIDPIVVEYALARQDYEQDASVVADVREYNVQRMLYETELQKEEKDTLLIESLDKRIKELAEKLQSNGAMLRLSHAEDELNKLLADINAQLNSYIIPEHSCGGNCGSCGGCH